MKKSEDHCFGGPWTEIKLDILKKYLSFFTTALGEKGFKLVYIDACAGSGRRTEVLPELPLLGEKQRKLYWDGSPRIALDIERRFDHYIFIETDRKRFAELEKIQVEFPQASIELFNDDANQVINNLMVRFAKKKHAFRGVIFLDPYGLQIHWNTLRSIARSQIFDVWYLFPLNGVSRQAANKLERVEDYKKDILNKVMGTPKWETAFYGKSEIPMQGHFFETPEERKRRATQKEIEHWFLARLKTIFSHVSNPLPLPFSGPQYFSLFFCVSNPSPRAIGLATKVAKYILDAKTSIV